jgi:hypothetical protein
MSAIIIQFPRPYRRSDRRPFDVVHVIRGDVQWSEWWTIAGSFGWLHTSFGDAVNDAFEEAARIGVPIAVEVPHA